MALTPNTVTSKDSKCENKQDGQSDECSDLFNCCFCGGDECGCRYCFDCNACEHCLEEE
jgi:hypothetical protein